MYSDWASLLPEIQSESGDQSVLSRYSYSTSREVVSGIVRNLSTNMTRCVEGLEDNLLMSDNDMAWTMEIVCFGLSLPASDREVTSECVGIYCEWMSCITEPRKSVPIPMVDEPNKYFCQMLHHLIHLFRPRNGAGADYTKLHMAMCNRVLKTLQNVSSSSKILTPDSWVCLLKFLLAICDNLLGPPTLRDDLGSHMCEKILSVLFETWLASCGSGNFPSPSLWKTLHQMCQGWRHHPPLITQWHKINFFLTSLLLKMFHGPGSMPASGGSSSCDEDGTLLLSFQAPNDVVVQCWFRFLHLIGNPIDFSRPRVISSTQRFLHAALASQEVVEPHQHECLKALPHIFYKAMKCISIIAAAFLGSNQKSYIEMDSLASSSSSQSQSTEPPSITPPPARKQQRVTSFFPQLIKNRDASSRMSLGETWASASTPVQPSTPSIPSFVPAPLDTCGEFSFFRPRVNSLLHLLGSWLFDAGLVGAEVVGPQKEEDWGNDGMQQQYETGRSQACGTLCRIFCSVKTDEEVLKVYIARFYAVVFYGLKVDLETSSHPVLINIVLNSSDFFKVNLVGSQVLVPHYLRAIEFLQTLFRYRHETTDEDVDQRYASIQILISMLCFPLHFRYLEIKNILDDQRHMRPSTNFYDLQPTLIKLVLKMLEKEVDPLNTQMLLGGIALLVADMAVYEEKSKSSKGLPELLELFEKSSSVICERLLRSWTSELTSALSSMEVLQFFSTLRVLKGRARGEDSFPGVEASVLELNSKKIVVTICDFVVIQCSKGPVCHNKDLHSSIVSAFQCLTTWLVEHDYLLQDGAVLHTVLQVTELGISGSRSQARLSDPPIYKGDKELKPISLRVKDAAEALLATIVDHVGCFPSPSSGPESLCTLLDEDSFLSKFAQEIRPKFQYFVADGAVIMGLFELPANQETEITPNLVVITRSSFGRHVWLLKLCHQSKSKIFTPPSTASSDIQSVSTDQGAQGSAPLNIEVPKYFPDSVNQVNKVLADLSIPPIERTMPNYEEQLENLRKIIQQQQSFENDSYRQHINNYKTPAPCEPPSSSKISNAARLFLSHFGFLTLDHLRGGSVAGGMFPTLIKLNESNSTLSNDLKSLDGISVRTSDTAHVYYVKAGQTRIEDMLTNVLTESGVSTDFSEFLLSLGWPVDVNNHPGWTGNPSNSWVIRDPQNVLADDTSHPATGVSCYDGKNKVLYWSDVAMEIVFLVPTSESVVKNETPPIDLERSSKPSATTSDNEQTTEGESLKLRRSPRSGGQEVQVVIVWLEHYEDHATFPIDDLTKLSNHQQASIFKNQKQTPMSANNFCVIFVHPLHNGLFRIHLRTSALKVGGPLVDGAVVSRRVLGQMIRQTTCNVYRRRTLETDIHQPPHVKRRIFIKEIVQRHKCSMSESDFCTSLFQC